MTRSAPPPSSWFDPALLVCTWFGSGRLRPAPGTWGSIAALPFAWVIAWFWSPFALIPAAALIFLIGWFCSNRVLKHCRTRDPSWIVIDEVAGQWLTLAVAPIDAFHWILGFMLFRAFDIVKPWPVSWADRQVGGGLGVMLDDVIAGLYAALVLFAVGLIR